jgi:hypothetical protein
MAKGDRWSDDPDVKVREMRTAETVLGVIREREFQVETTGKLLEIERLTSSLEGGGGQRAQPVTRKGLRTPAQAVPRQPPTLHQVRFGGGRRKRGCKATAPTAHPTYGACRLP